MMANSLDEFDWTQFDSCAGKDIDLGSLLHDLGSDELGSRANARGMLSDWPYEGFGRLGAMPQVLRFMIETLSDESSQDKPELLELIVELAEGASDYSEFKQWYSESREDLTEEIRRAFESGGETYMKMLSGTTADMRIAACKALSHISSSTSLGPLLDQLRVESDDSVCREVMTAIGRLKPDAVEPEIEHRLKSNDPETALSAATAVCRITHGDHETAFATLAKLATTPGKQIKQSDVASSALSVIEELGDESLRAAVDQWVNRMTTVSIDDLAEYVHRLIICCFPPHPYPAIRSDTISSAQSKVLAEIIACDSYWEIQNYVVEQEPPYPPLTVDVARERKKLLSRYTMPNSRKELREFVQDAHRKSQGRD